MVAFTELPSPPGTRFDSVRLVAETGSTNADLLAAAETGAAEGAVLVTDHQRAGRGRQRRVWHDEPGNSLLVSVLLRPQPDRAPLLPLVAGLAAVDAATAEVEGDGGTPQGGGADAGPRTAGRSPIDRPAVGLKWPNDVLVPGLGERKLAGILAEASSVGARTSDRPTVVVGMGMNLRWRTPPPPEIGGRAVTLAEVAGREIGRDRVLGRFLVALERWLAALEAGEPVIDAYRGVCLTIGRQVRFATGAGEYRGRATDVSDRGTLLLDTDDGRRVELSAGDAHHL